MNSRKFYVFFITSALWSWNQIAGVDIYNGVFINQKNNQLVEMSTIKNFYSCFDCVSACPASPKSDEEQLLNQYASITKNGLFLRNVYSDAENATDIKVEICENPPIPSIIWETELEVYGIGYEVYLKEGKTELKCGDDYAKFNEVISGEPNFNPRQLPNNDSIKTYKDGIFTKFQIVNQPDQKFEFFWLQVFSVIESSSKSHREIVFTKDAINDYFLGEKTSHCENYLLGYDTQVIQPIKSRQQNAVTDEIVEVEDQTNAEEATSEQRIENRLQKTQILPMHMFHTFSARLATCMYINMAYIWSSIAETRMKNVDLYLYSIYRLWPSEIRIIFGVNSKSTEAKVDDPQEHEIFRKYPIPEVIFRVVEYKLKNEFYYAVVVIHNDLNPILWNNRICLNSMEGWNQVEDDAADLATPGLSYTCILTKKVYNKLGIDRYKVKGVWNDLKLNKFPTLDSNDQIVPRNVLQKVHDEFERILRVYIPRK